MLNIMNLERDLEFLYEVGSLRFLQRTWKQFLNPDFENISEHIFRVTWIALVLAKHEQARDHEKIIKMALVHDLPESRTGDVNSVHKLYAKRQGEKAVKDIFQQTALKELVKIWEEYEERESVESKIVKDADNLDVDLELIEQEFRGHKLTDLWKKKRKQSVYKNLYTKSAKSLWKIIYVSNPHDWHSNAKDRFSADDWKKGRIS